VRAGGLQLRQLGLELDDASAGVVRHGLKLALDDERFPLTRGAALGALEREGGLGLVLLEQQIAEVEYLGRVHPLDQLRMPEVADHPAGHEIGLGLLAEQRDRPAGRLAGLGGLAVELRAAAHLGEVALNGGDDFRAVRGRLDPHDRPVSTRHGLQPSAGRERTNDERPHPREGCGLCGERRGQEASRVASSRRSCLWALRASSAVSFCAEFAAFLRASSRSRESRSLFSREPETDGLTPNERRLAGRVADPQGQARSSDFEPLVVEQTQ